MKSNQKHLIVDSQTHKLVKSKAVESNMTISDYLAYLIKKGG